MFLYTNFNSKKDRNNIVFLSKISQVYIKKISPNYSTFIIFLFMLFICLFIVATDTLSISAIHSMDMFCALQLNTSSSSGVKLHSLRNISNSEETNAQIFISCGEVLALFSVLLVCMSSLLQIVL